MGKIRREVFKTGDLEGSFPPKSARLLAWYPPRPAVRSDHPTAPASIRPVARGWKINEGWGTVRTKDVKEKVISNKYKIISLIGKGGMGRIYQAQHVELGSRVAIKFLRSTRGKARFEQEARVAAQLVHDNICPVLDIGEDDDGTSYLVMPLLEGESLQSLMSREGRLSLERACDISSQVLSALAAAHAENIIHRDITPNNIFLTCVADRPDFVKLLDFGISKILRNSSMTREPDVSLTQEGTLLGTPRYMSPEQALGEKNIDTRTDLYSVGVVLYFMVTGQLPFLGETKADLIMKILMGTLTAPRTLRPDMSPTLEAVILKALQRDPKDRFPTADAFRAAIQEALASTWAGDDDLDVSDVTLDSGVEEQVGSAAPLGSAAAPRSSSLLDQPSVPDDTDTAVQRFKHGLRWSRWLLILVVAASGAMIVGAAMSWVGERDSREPQPPAAPSHAERSDEPGASSPLAEASLAPDSGAGAVASVPDAGAAPAQPPRGEPDEAEAAEPARTSTAARPPRSSPRPRRRPRPQRRVKARPASTSAAEEPEETASPRIIIDPEATP